MSQNLKRPRGSSPVVGLAATMMALCLALVGVGLFTGPAAADTSVTVIKITDPIAAQLKDGPTSFGYLALDVNYPGGPVWLSSNPDGTGDTFVNDAVDIDINPSPSGGTLYYHDYSGNCGGTITSAPPLDISGSFLHTGSNHLRISLIDNCGSIGSSAMYLVFGLSQTPPTPGPTPTSPTTVSSTPTSAPPSSATPSSPSTTKPPGYKCGTVKFFGLRGSGEKPWQGEGMGDTVDTDKNAMARSIPGLRFEAVDYPAIDVLWWDPAYPANYVSSEWAGRDSLLKSVRNFLQFCPTTYAVIAGYSQGAQAAGDAYALFTDEERKHIAAVVEFGDPVFNPDKSQNLVNVGTYSRQLSGILLQTGYDPQTIPGKWQARVRSYCVKGDPVCNYQKRDIPPCIASLPACGHLQYVNRGWTNMAAQWAVGRWQRLPRLR